MALTESMFGLAADVEDDRLCRDIPDSQCREEPRNLVRVTLAHIGSKAGDALADPKVVMPWLMGALGAPAFLTAMIVPIRESLALLPQVIVGGVIRRFAKRKYFWVYAALIQGLAVIAMAGVSDLIVVATSDAVMILPRGSSQDVKKIVEALKAQGHATLDIPF